MDSVDGVDVYYKQKANMKDPEHFSVATFAGALEDAKDAGLTLTESILSKYVDRVAKVAISSDLTHFKAAWDSTRTERKLASPTEVTPDHVRNTIAPHIPLDVFEDVEGALSVVAAPAEDAQVPTSQDCMRESGVATVQRCGG